MAGLTFSIISRVLIRGGSIVSSWVGAEDPEAVYEA